MRFTIITFIIIIFLLLYKLFFSSKKINWSIVLFTLKLNQTSDIIIMLYYKIKIKHFPTIS